MKDSPSGIDTNSDRSISSAPDLRSVTFYFSLLLFQESMAILFLQYAHRITESENK